MKTTFLIISLLISTTLATGQGSSSAVDLITTWSQDGRFYLKSTPFDNQYPTSRGTTSVYENGNPTPLYVFERGFDSVRNDSNNLVLSNNGEVIFYVIPWGADEEKEDLKSVTIFKHGRIFKSFTETEITGCDQKKERCRLLYSNYDDVVDKQKSNWGMKNYKKTFKDGVDERERFLSDFPIFSFDDTVYLTDSKRQVHLFDLKDGNSLGSNSFDSIFEQIKAKGRPNKIEITVYDAPIFLGFPNLKNGNNTNEALADYIGMKTSDTSEQTDEQYKWYSFKMNSNLLRDGSLEIEEIEVYADLPKDKIIEFFKVNKFDSSSVPKIFPKWNTGDKYFSFRKPDDRVARQEKEQEKIERRKQFEIRLTLESIDGVFIPKDLSECFVQLDKLLTDIDKKEMRALPKRDDMIRYHMGLGMWMRNNWRLWGGSRLQKYFTDKGIEHPDEMSSVILYHYYDWLNGNKETWKDWEKIRKGR